MLLSILYTANTCIGSIVNQIRGTLNRAWCDNAIKLWVHRVLKLVKVQCDVINPYNVMPEAGQATIIMCNHSSLYDIPLSLYAFPNVSIRMLAKKEMAKIPLMGKAMRLSEYPFIDRHNRTQAIQDLKQLHTLLESGIVMWVAPEGTRSHDGKLGKLKKGAFITAIEAKAIIIPIGIRGACNILPARTFHFHMNQKTEVHIGKPIDAAKFTLENKEELINQTYKAMQELLGQE